MGDSKNTTKKSSIMCYLTEGSTEELTYFKELLELVFFNYLAMIIRI